jgi:hypothetical protein
LGFQRKIPAGEANVMAERLYLQASQGTASGEAEAKKVNQQELYRRISWKLK